MALQSAEPLNPTLLLVLQGWIIREAIDLVLLLIGLTVVVLLHLHLLLLLGGLGLQGCLFVDSGGLHFCVKRDLLL